MFAEHAFDVKHFGPLVRIDADVIPLREHGGMVAPGPHLLVTAPAPVVVAAPRPVRMPDAVYRRRRVAAAAVAAAVVTLVFAVARPDSVPSGEANPWRSVGETSLPAELPGVYVVQPGDTLWDIARTLAPGADPRAVVHELAAAVGGAALEPGQRIVIGAVPAVVAARDSDRQSAQPVAVELTGADR